MIFISGKECPVGRLHQWRVGGEGCGIDGAKRILAVNDGTYFPADQPPSTSRLDPVTIDDSSAARYSAAAAISSGRAIRPLNWIEAISA